MKINLKSFSLFILVCVLKAGLANGQSDSIRHQISVGAWAYHIQEPYLSFEFKTYFKKKAFYNFSVEAFYYGYNKSVSSIDNYRVDFATSAAVGIYYNFFRVCRFSMAARLTGFIARENLDFENSTGLMENNRSREGVFIGPDFALEVRAVRLKSSEIVLFSKIYTGFGLMHENSYYKDPTHSYGLNDVYKEWLGGASIGIGFRF